MKKPNKKGILKFLFSRTFIFGFLIFLQFVFLTFLVLKVSEIAGQIVIILQLLSLCVVIWLVSKDDNPSYKLAWVIAIMCFPIMGGIYYIFFGNKNMPRILRNKITEYDAEVERRMKESVKEKKEVFEEIKDKDKGIASRISYIINSSNFPVCKNTQSDYFPLGEDKFEKLKEELKKAEKFIFMEYFIIEEGKMWDTILEILKEKVKEGIEVRVMFDDMGSVETLPPGYGTVLEKHGIKCAVFNPFKPHLNMAMNYRDHRKICVIDGNVGFCGGINLADEYINEYPKHGHWKDTAVALYGDGVWSLTMMFLTLWDFTKNEADLDYSKYMPTKHYKSDGYVQPYGDTPLDNTNVGENIYMQIINRATDYVYITTPYLILDNEMVIALKNAAETGVDVRIITPHIADKWYVHIVTRSFYKNLIRSGVKIYEYTPGFVHAKMFVSDDTSAIVGTTNMDYRSFYLHFECGVCFYYSTMVDKVKNDIEETLNKCQEITMDDVNQISIFRRILAAIIRIFSPMM